MFTKIKIGSSAIAATLLLAACTTNPYTGEQQVSKTAVGSVLGAAVGAGAGAIIGGTTSAKTRTAVLIGAGVGALTGAGVGAYMDNQETKLRRRLQASGVSVTRNGHEIILNMPGNVTFDTAQSAIKPQFYEVLNSVAIVLNEYNRTIIDVDGHTDNVGSNSSNLDLSQRRARSVAEYLASRQIDPRRLSLRGFGEDRPIASNASARGRSQNRRVEIRITPILAN
jgi:outer membrane protein OmpA-like peptidoglycan-associated protein